MPPQTMPREGRCLSKPERPTASSRSWNLPARAAVQMLCSMSALTSRGARRAFGYCPSPRPGLVPAELRRRGRRKRYADSRRRLRLCADLPDFGHGRTADVTDSRSAPLPGARARGRGRVRAALSPRPPLRLDPPVTSARPVPTPRLSQAPRRPLPTSPTMLRIWERSRCDGGR